MPHAPYERHFKLQANPFSIAPDPDWLYMSTQHREALAHLQYGLGTDGGIVLLTGDAGTGKTTVCKSMQGDLPDDVDVACIDDPDLTVDALVSSACRAFGVDTQPQASVKRHVDRLNAFLLANHQRGRRSVLMIDEAHRLGPDVLEQLRLLTNLETNERKLLQILLVGRAPLRDLLERQDLRQLSQRIVARCHLGPLGRNEVAPYVQHRLAMAGGSAQIVPSRLTGVLHALSKGVPRTINLLCDRAMLDASVHGMDWLDAQCIAQAARELGLDDAAPPWTQPSTAIAAALVVAVCAAAVVIAGNEHHGTAMAATAPRPDAVVDVPEKPRTEIPLDSPALRVHRDMPPSSSDEFTWPQGVTPVRSAALAHDALLRRWGLDARTAGTPCVDRVEGLRCLHGRAGIDELRAMNLPAVLHLKDAKGLRADAVLVGIEGDSVRLDAGAGERRLGTAALAAWWHGDYTLLWRAPPGFGDPLRRGSRGAAVEWLRTRLALWRGEPAPPRSEAPFDEHLLDQVREFQVTEGLAPDGIAGVWTLTRLAARTDPNVPTLVPASGPNSIKAPDIP